MAIPKQNVCTHEIGQRIPVMVEDGLRWWNLLGGFRLLGGSLAFLLGGEMEFRTVDAFEMGLETGLTSMLVNSNGTRGRDAERID